MDGKTTNSNSTAHLQQRTTTFLPVAGGLHVLDRRVYEAVTGSDQDSLLRLAHTHLGPGVKTMAVNLGTGRTMARHTPWVIETLLALPGLDLFVSANILDHPDLLQQYGSRITINAVTAEPAVLDRATRCAAGYGNDLVVLLVRPGLTPAGIDDRLQLAAEVLDLARQNGLRPANLYLDPVLSCHPDPLATAMSRGIPEVGMIAESISLIRELDRETGTIVGIDPGSRLSGRGDIQERVLALLVSAGLDAAILDCRNKSRLEDILSRAAAAQARYREQNSSRGRAAA